jgi:IS605 OrfB family transposase
MSEIAWESQAFRKYDLHHKTYHRGRKTFGLGAQVVVRAVAKVADAYKTAFRLHRDRDRRIERRNQKLVASGKQPTPIPVMERCRFGESGAVAYDDRILAWKIDRRTVSIWTVAGRIHVRFQAGEHQLAMLQHRSGESDLVFRHGEFYLAATCDVPVVAGNSATEYLGVDLGVANIATDSDGNRHSGSQVKSVRFRHRRLRSRLQSKQTRAAKRRLKKLSGKESRFARYTNHCVSKEIVAQAQGSGRGIKLEDLSEIRDRITVRRKQRVVLHSWAFYQLRMFIAYKAVLAGVPVVLVDPANTSRECAECGYIDKRNRPNQSTFRCLGCGHTGHADVNAARVISGRAARKPAEGSNAARLSNMCSSTHVLVKSHRL